VHAFDEALEGLRVLFYCPDGTVLIHNMSFLRDDRLTAPSVWVIARAGSCRTCERSAKWTSS